MSFPMWMRRAHGKKVGWACETCGKKWRDGWLLEFHHKLPTSKGGSDTFDNMKCLCMQCHYEVHVELGKKNMCHPASAELVLARIKKTGGRHNR